MTVLQMNFFSPSESNVYIYVILIQTTLVCFSVSLLYKSQTSSLHLTMMSAYTIADSMDSATGGSEGLPPPSQIGVTIVHNIIKVNVDSRKCFGNRNFILLRIYCH